MARGHSFEELFEYWKETPVGSGWIQYQQERMEAAVAKVRAEYLPSLPTSETPCSDV